VYVSLVAAGEQSGTLDDTLERLAKQLEKEQQIISKIRGALIYPILVLVVIIGVLVFMLTTVLPQVAGLYKELDKGLPLMTQILFSISQFITSYWYLVLLVLVAAIFGARAYSHTPKGREQFDRMKLKWPVFGSLYKKVYAARFSRTMSTLVNSGVPLLQALQISSEAVDNVIIAKIVLNAREQVKSGKALSETLMDKPEILKLVPQMIKVGEDSGTLGQMLDKVATYYEDEVDQAVKNISAIIEPALIIVLGLAVLLIVIAVLYPIYSLVFSININNASSSGAGTNF
jgi:type IV pilus assembly protein PilC